MEIAAIIDNDLMAKQRVNFLHEHRALGYSDSGQAEAYVLLIVWMTVTSGTNEPNVQTS